MVKVNESKADIATVNYKLTIISKGLLVNEAML